MARLASQEKGGFYPTPPEITEAIGALLSAAYVANDKKDVKQVRLLDPCCGTGEALEELAQAVRETTTVDVATFGIELERERGLTAAKKLGRTLRSDFFKCSIGHEAFSMILLNPPYDTEAESEDGPSRTEMAFLKRCTPYLKRGEGHLVLIVPRKILPDLARYLSTHYSNIQRIGWNAEEDPYGQAVVACRRKQQPFPSRPTAEEITSWGHETASTHESAKEGQIILPALNDEEIYFASNYWDPEDMAAEADRNGLWRSPGLARTLWPEAEQRTRPLMPLRRGHTAMLMAAGFLDNIAIQSPEGRRILVKGRTVKELKTIEDTAEQTVVQERMTTTITTLDMATGEFKAVKA